MDDEQTENALDAAYRETASGRWMHGATALMARIRRLESCGYSDIEQLDRGGTGNPVMWVRFRCKGRDGAVTVRAVRMGPRGWEVRKP